MDGVYIRVPRWLRYLQLFCLAGVYVFLLTAGSFLVSIDPHPLLLVHGGFITIGTACGLVGLAKGRYKLEAASLVWVISGLFLVLLHPKHGGLFVACVILALILSTTLRLVQLVSFAIEHERDRSL